VFENRVVRRMFGPKKDRITGEWKRLPNEKLHAEYSPNIFREKKIKFNEMGRPYNTNGTKTRFTLCFSVKT
jgi:hypothetical protein